MYACDNPEKESGSLDQMYPCDYTVSFIVKMKLPLLYFNLHLCKIVRLEHKYKHLHVNIPAMLF